MGSSTWEVAKLQRSFRQTHLCSTILVFLRLGLASLSRAKGECTGSPGFGPCGWVPVPSALACCFATAPRSHNARFWELSCWTWLMSCFEETFLSPFGSSLTIRQHGCFPDLQSHGHISFRTVERLRSRKARARTRLHFTALWCKVLRLESSESSRIHPTSLVMAVVCGDRSHSPDLMSK